MAWRRLRKVGVLVAAAFVLAGSTGCELEDILGPRVESSLVRTASFVVVGDPAIDVESANGAISLHGVEGQSDVEVRMTLRSRGTTLEQANDRLGRIVVHAEQEGGRIVLRYVASQQDADVRRTSGVEFDVTLPSTAEICAETSNGAIRVAAIRGAVDLATSNGAVVVEDFAGGVSASTSNGEIVVTRGEGVLRLKTSNGRIRIGEMAGAVDAETSNGEIAFSGRLADGSHRLRSSNGRIIVRVPEAVPLHIVAHTHNAAITSSLPLIGDVEGRAWDAVLNPPATATLTIETSNGEIHLGSLPPAGAIP
ncbi:MAG: DUF4097 family beta strand repeat-containing protein [Candidatus Bipolaricaulis sp.]|nr:DUF4097 family beta strand repeat-containing protein [Candidatus Bipolaricaulis sp.]